MSDETLIERVARRVRREDDRRENDRRAPPAWNPVDLVKWLPLLLAVSAGYGGYKELQAKVAEHTREFDRLEASAREYRAEQKETHAALWRAIREQ